jgi:DNA-binding MarR family transcriptional regulator
LSRDSQDPLEIRGKLLAELAREFRRLNANGASFFRAAAARTGMTVTDLQVIDILDSANLLTAGQLADLTGLTTGAITGMLNRLEAAGLVRRERDPNDGRRFIVRLVHDKDAMRQIDALFDSVGYVWQQIVADYDDEQIAFLLEFLKRGNALSEQETVQLRETPAGEAGVVSAPLGKITSGKLVASKVGHITLRADDTIDTLYQASFEGYLPEVTANDGSVTIRYPRRLSWLPVAVKRSAEVTLNSAIPWQIMIQGDGSEIAAELDRLDLARLEVKGGASMIHLELPAPSGPVLVRISGAASTITVRRPAGVAARVHLKGWSSAFIFDDQQFTNLGNDVRLQSPGYDESAPGYDIEVVASVSATTITTE